MASSRVSAAGDKAGGVDGVVAEPEVVVEARALPDELGGAASVGKVFRGGGRRLDEVQDGGFPVEWRPPKAQMSAMAGAAGCRS